MYTKNLRLHTLKCKSAFHNASKSWSQILCIMMISRGMGLSYLEVVKYWIHCSKLENTPKFATTRFVASLKATIIAPRFATSSTTTMTTPRFATSLKAPLGIKICNKLEGNNGICNKLGNNNGICKKLESSKLEGSNNRPLELLFICECLLAFLKLNVWHLSNMFASLKVWWRWRQQWQQIQKRN